MNIWRFCYRENTKLTQSLVLFFRMPVPQLPTHQDCHELWSKKRRRQMREAQDQSNQSAVSANTNRGSIPSLPGSEENSQG